MNSFRRKQKRILKQLITRFLFIKSFGWLLMRKTCIFMSWYPLLSFFLYLLIVSVSVSLSLSLPPLSLSFSHTHIYLHASFIVVCMRIRAPTYGNAIHCLSSDNFKHNKSYVLFTLNSPFSFNNDFFFRIEECYPELLNVLFQFILYKENQLH